MGSDPHVPDGQVVVVLGGSGGLGRGLARRYALRGARVVLADIAEEELLAVAESMAREGAAPADTARMDVADAAEVEALARAVANRFGRIDIVCNTVGVIAKGVSWQIPIEDWRWQIDVNLLGVVHVLRSFTPVLMAQGHGHIINTASTVALTSRPGNAAYVATKHAVLGICESLQQDLRAADSPVRVSVIIPGAIRSRLYAAVGNRQARYGGPQDHATAKALDERRYLEEYGADPDVLADIIIEQLDAGRFYVFGRPTDMRYAEEHVAGLREGAFANPGRVRVRPVEDCRAEPPAGPRAKWVPADRSSRDLELPRLATFRHNIRVSLRGSRRCRRLRSPEEVGTMTSRLRRLAPDELNPAQRELYDQIVSGPRGTDGLVDGNGALRGPFNAMLLAPEIGQHLQALGVALRFRGEVSDRVREMSILVVAAAFRCEFERVAHEAVARSVGVADAEIAAIAGGNRPDLVDPAERDALDVVATLLREHRLDDAAYDRAVETLTAPILFELSTIVGYYSLLAIQLPLFGIG
jgi:4-carboxymuconolactone decarboxylase